MGYAGYSLYYSWMLSKQQPIGCRVISLNAHETEIKTRLLQNLATVSGFSFIFLFVFYFEALLYFQKYSIFRWGLFYLLKIFYFNNISLFKKR